MTAADFSKVWPVVRFDEIDSTNEEARRRAQSGDTGPCWLTAERQTAGRGRLGRQWDSPTGNLFATALLPYPRPPAEAALACFSAGLAVIDAAKAAGVDTAHLRLKWPNDVLAGPAKLAGILIETGTQHGQLWMAAGFGVNVASAPDVPGRPTACLANLSGGVGLSASRLLDALDIAFRARLARLTNDGFAATREDWLAKAAHLGGRVELQPASGRVEGVMKGLGDDGALIIELDDGTVTHVRAGEISILG
ncbi:MAG: biotin--[acetyl-CoA-carboxylase] ligase [Hyphomonadaceae bacterium]|nr:biotin--[acetyl-CoA-carboxylase] ligase [Hyphomonadaceae bacterium]